MSDLEIMNSKLVFFRWFYQETTGLFLEIKRKIELVEEPYVPTDDPACYGEPPFLNEWLDADDGVRLQRQLCLNVLQRTFREFMDSVVSKHRDFPANRPDERDWFKNYQRWFLKEFNIDWSQSGADLNLLLEMTLARNCVQHGGEKHHQQDRVYDAHSLIKRQGSDYVKRFPQAVFIDQEEGAIWKGSSLSESLRIDFPQEALESSVFQIQRLCAFVDQHLPGYVFYR